MQRDTLRAGSKRGLRSVQHLPVEREEETMRHESPCKTCADHPCNKHKNCEKRWEYVSTFKETEDMRAVDIDGSYRLLPQ
jgi:hypothetical protein